ncbi:MAG: type II secretion system GspH family protein [Lentisphaerales bacterium]|nr:type II secretion system GspH family protein [Lentisphaerales bacterium]
MDREKAKSAFTIIELSMVISIIGILTSMLMPSLMGAREKVKSSVCQKNLSQIMLGASQYSDDWNGSLPIDTTTYGAN